MSELRDPAKATKYDAWAYVLIGLLGIPLFALGVGAFVLPPGVSFQLVRRGLDEGRTSWLVLGVLTGALWLLFVYFLGRKVMAPRPTESPDDE